MKMSKKSNNLIHEFIESYTKIVNSGFDERISQVKPDLQKKHIYECLWGLLARQATLSIELAKAPTTWNGHVAPLFLRCMIDAYITMAWIFESPVDRSEKYIKYGLGQEKLYLEHMEQALQEETDPSDAEIINNMIKSRKQWLNIQLAEWATEINLGSWSGHSAREMANEIKRESLYHHAYAPFSGPVHNMWQHVGIYNVKQCENPMHKFHLVPAIKESPIHPDFMYRSSKYISQSFELFDTKLGIKCEIELPDDFFVRHELFS